MSDLLKIVLGFAIGAVVAVVFLLFVVGAFMSVSRPAKAAMEPEEIMVRLATGLPLTADKPSQRRKHRRARRG